MTEVAGPDDERMSTESDLAADHRSEEPEHLTRALATLGAKSAFELDREDLLAEYGGEVDLEGTVPERRKPLLNRELLVSVAGQALDALAPASGLSAMLQLAFSKQFAVTRRSILDSVSVGSLYTPESLAARSQEDDGLRSDRMPLDFFGEHAVEIDSLDRLLQAISRTQSKQHRHHLVWRGQRDASWAVHSSLFRRLEPYGAVSEHRLVAAEVEALDAAATWGISRQRPLKFLADLQHHGAPTRLLDATLEPELAAWFAVEPHPDHDDAEGLVLAWGRSPITKTGIPALSEDVGDETAEPFWHGWSSDDERHRVDWGTGTKTWAWFPPALNERMRAQRAGFLIEAGPLLTAEVVDVFNASLSIDWRAHEIARATSIVGLPARHDIMTKPNAANLVPVFAFRILSSAKEPIRAYLADKGLTHSSVYPDFGGLVSHLSGPFGPRGSLAPARS